MTWNDEEKRRISELEFRQNRHSEHIRNIWGIVAMIAILVIVFANFHHG